ncbi:hypothetical protein FHS99_003460 [Sphingomonas prati]|uniref:Uncharacterized protein n=1 Tax=Sphingomonas prati TaxID=1843237 RepID=A0A7W9F2Z5_9SPHN|nr:hypothetical protein [Sphingomonas prati]MBB5730952.1 hypothetical protein [Sphingomonas prati]
MLDDLAIPVVEGGERAFGMGLASSASPWRALSMDASSKIQISGFLSPHGVAGLAVSILATVIGSPPIARASSSAAVPVGASARTLLPRAFAASAWTRRTVVVLAVPALPRVPTALRVDRSGA